MKHIIKQVLILVIGIYSAGLCTAQNESYYNEIIAQKLNGQREVRVDNGRVDIVTAEYAIETEWAENWKHSIGQALWYGLQTNKKPGIVIIMRSMDDRKHGIRLQSAIDYAGLGNKIKVWFYPEDFGGSFEEVKVARVEYKSNLVSQNGNYTRNKNSGVRHNSKCGYFACDNCVPCGASDGKKACGKCGG